MQSPNSLDTIRYRVQTAWTPSDAGSEQPGHYQMQKFKHPGHHQMQKSKQPGHHQMQGPNSLHGHHQMQRPNSLDTIRCRDQTAWTPSDAETKQPGHHQMQSPNSQDTMPGTDFKQFICTSHDAESGQPAGECVQKSNS